MMKRTVRLRTLFLTAIVCLIAASFSVDVWAQTDSETDVAQSMGVGLQSRFASGATPIQLSRTSIVPGTPMSVNSTMNNIMSSNSGNSFGGILARYDTSNFGKFFGSGSLNTTRTGSSRIDALDSLTQEDNEVENVETERMYPARLVVDFEKCPVRSLASPEGSSNISAQVDNIIARVDFDRHVEEIKVENDGPIIFLRGKVKSARTARLLESVLSLQPGVSRVVNELDVLVPNAAGVDLFGRPL